MRYSLLIERLQNLINYKPSQTELGKILGIAQTAISGRANRDSNFSAEEIKKIELYYHIAVESDNITLDYYPEVCGSCGNGVFQFSTRKEQITVPKNVLFKSITPGKQYFIVNAYGNSMQPFIYDKDKLIIENYDGEQIIDNRPYIFAYKDEIFIKRLAKNINQLMIIPENTDYDVIKLEGAQLQDVCIIGQVVGLMRDLR